MYVVFWLHHLGDTLGLMEWMCNTVYGFGMAEKPYEFMMIVVSFGGFYQLNQHNEKKGGQSKSWLLSRVESLSLSQFTIQM